MRGSTKYGGENDNRMRMSGPELKESEWSELNELYSYGLSKGTWSNYKTAEKLLIECCIEKGIARELPVNENTVLAFVHWLALNRGVTSGTISNYLSGIRQLHVMNGVPDRNIRTERIKLLLAGIKNKEMAKKRSEGIDRRRPITPDILRLLKARVAESNMRGVDQRLIWSVSSIIFHGAFRIHELVCKVEGSFDPDFTLLGSDILIVSGSQDNPQDSLQLRIKAPKEDKAGNSIIVDVYETSNDLCPVTAFKKWKQRSRCEDDQPVFRWSNGTPLTGRKFNEILKERLTGYVDGAEKLFSSHSFRSGAASMLGCLGYSDADIKAVGRWGSRAFLEYVRLPRTQRIEVARLMGKDM